MPVPTVIDQEAFDALDEWVQTNVYKPGTGKFQGKYVLDGTPAEGLEVTNPTQLRSALQTERTRAGDLEQQLGAFGDLNPEEARAAIEAVGQLGDWGDDEKRQAAVAQAARPLVQQAEAKAGKLEKKLTAREKQLRKVLVTDRARVALAAAGADSDGVEVLLPHVESQLEPVEVGDTLDVQVWDRATNQRRVGDDGGFADLNSLVTQMRDEPRFARSFTGTNADGTGSQQTRRPGPAQQSGTKTVKRSDQEAMNANWEGIRDGTVKVIDG